MGRIIFLVYILIIGTAYTLPVKEKKDTEKEETNKVEDGTDWELNLEYGRYLKEVVQALESDPEFRKKLENANVDDIKSGKISRELHFVDHNIRSQLDELKRRELERLRHIAIQEHEKRNGIDRTKLKAPLHLDHNNPSKFEPEDLKKLILQLNKDLEEVDRKRQDEFKQYEMQKEFEYKQKLNGLNEERKNEFIKEHEEKLKKHKDHPKLHHPGSKQQLEEVWEEQDHMKAEDFDPKTFFHVHDLDGNGYWDENEVKALFQKELDKMYDPNAPEDDLMERYEEMERMREHVFSETDLNRDKLISFEEFLEQTKKQEFNRDEGWQGLDDQEMYNQQEYEEYERQRQMEIQRLVESGAIQPPPGYHGMNPPQPLHIPQDHIQQGYQQVPQGYQQVPQGYQQVPQGYQQVPQGYQQVPQGHQAVPQGYQQIPQGHQAVPQGYQQGHQAVPQGYQQVPQGHQAVPQGYQQVPEGHQAVPQGYQQVPQALPQGHQAAPQGNIVAVPQAHAEPNSQSKPEPIAIAQSQGLQAAPQQPNVQHQAAPQQPNVQHPTPIKTPDNSVNHAANVGDVSQNNQQNLNQIPQVKPVANNHVIH